MAIIEKIRPHVRDSVPYSSARDEFTQKAAVYLDANEMPTGPEGYLTLNRYPDPHHKDIRKKLAINLGLDAENIFVSNGSDESIDLLYRIFCEPKNSSSLIFPPTYGIYEVLANLNQVRINKVNLKDQFQLDIDKVKQQAALSDLTFLCNPNNPTGTLYSSDQIEEILQSTDSPVIVDEAYIHFSDQSSIINKLAKYDNLIVLQTFSKAWGLAGIRVGICFADKDVISHLYKVKPPYNVNSESQRIVSELLNNSDNVKNRIRYIIECRNSLLAQLSQFKSVQKVFESHSNFLLVRCDDAKRLYKFLLTKGIVVRDRSSDPLLENCLRITVGDEAENKSLLEAWKEYETLTFC